MTITRTLPSGCIAWVALAMGQTVALGQPAPIGNPVVGVDNQGVEWTPATGAAFYDLVRGDLMELRRTRGDFRAATRVCLTGQWDEYDVTRVSYPGVPQVGEGFFFLVRGGTATETGSYDSGGPGQAGTRDFELEAAVQGCSSPVAPHAPIAIAGDSGFTAANGVVGGSGTPADPWVISGWEISCPSMDGTAGIEVSGTQAPFIVRNVGVNGCQDGVLMDDTRNGSVHRSLIFANGTGLRMLSGGDAAIEGNQFSSFGQGGTGIEIANAIGVEIAANTLSADSVGIRLEGASSCSVHGNNLDGNTTQAIDTGGSSNAWNGPYPAGGNHWSDYQGADNCSGADQDDCSFPDNKGDTPYVLDAATSDRYPVMRQIEPEGDTFPPTLQIQSPAPGASVGAVPVPASGMAGDIGWGVVQRVEVRLNGGAWVTIGGTTPGPSTPWGSWVSLVPGSNWIQARAFDIAGNTSPTQSVNVLYTPASDPVWSTALLTDMASYLPGAPVIIEYRVTNTSASPVTLHFPTTCEASFDVRDVFNAVLFEEAAHSGGCFFVFTQRTWQPGQTVTYNFNWTQIDDAGVPVPEPASYQIRGFMYSEEPVPDGMKLIDVASNPANPVWETTLLTDAASYPPGAPVAISYRVKNLSSSPATLHFPDACESSFDVLDASDAVVYRWLAHVGCPAVITQRTWQPGETVTYDFTWPQTNDAGAPVPAPAGYRIRAFMLSDEVLPDTLHPIDITSGP